MLANLEFLTNLRLEAGRHGADSGRACLMEAASYVAGEPWSDHPKCVSPVLGSFGRSLNDRLPGDERQLLKQFIPRLLNTADDGQDEARVFMSADWAIRVAAPRWLDASGLKREAERSRGLAPVVDAATMRKARGSNLAARRAASAVRGRARRRLPADTITAYADAIAFAFATADVTVAVDAIAFDAADAIAIAVDADTIAFDVASAIAGAIIAAGPGQDMSDHWVIHRVVRKAILAKIEDPESEFDKVRRVTNAEAIDLFERMIDPSATQ